jgi:hypothetical protein
VAEIVLVVLVLVVIVVEAAVELIVHVKRRLSESEPSRLMEQLSITRALHEIGFDVDHTLKARSE